MAENNDTSVQPMQENGSIQAVQTGNIPLREGYQPVPVARKGYQAIDAAPPQSPPQSITSDIPVAIIPQAGGDVAGSGASADAQANSTTTTQSSQQAG